MKVYTKGGDTGETSLFGGERVRKNALRVQAFGEIDELNAVLGLARSAIGEADLDKQIRVLQTSLFDLGGELATPGADVREGQGKLVSRVNQEDVDEIEGWIDAFETELEPLVNFILPGGDRGAAFLHLARTVCRRAERRVVELSENEAVDEVVLRYLNRLSDLLFMMARVANRRAGVEESQWVGRKR
ncbi:MAG: cob(I)yrinic acid a,c-diamide adenosyltransferase [bacterium]|nr:cob(I)yrinic acid a,c-diamide adenosyltransferase [bacterium]